MSAMETIATDFLAGTEPEILDAIGENGLSLCVWERSPEPKVAAFLAEIVTLKMPLALDFTVEPGGSAMFAPRVQEQFGTRPSEPAAGSLLDDVDLLIARFRAASGASAIRVRLTRVVDAACAVFHVDTLRLRLLCTYHGDGTQWVPEEHADRRQLGLRGRSMRKANAAIAPDPSQIRTLPAWHVAIFKGRTFPGDGESALIHRSARQCCEDHARVRLVLDIAGEGKGC